jgi:hypothetical protein
MMRISIFGIMAAAGLASPAAAQSQLSLTIYNNDLALVEEVRTLDVKPGRNRLEFKDVSADIRPETVSLSAPGLDIVEQNFDFDLLTPDKLMEKAVGQQVRIVRTNPGNGQQVTETATVLAANEGVVLQIGDRIEVLRDDGAPTRVIFDKVPDNLRARPTLSVTVDAANGGPRSGVLSYLSRGLSWRSDYVAMFDEKTATLDLQGWITLTNNSGTSFTQARTQLVAGDINQRNYDRGATVATRRNVVQGGTGPGSARSLADYYVYPLKERTTIAQNQTKQVSFLEAHGVKARKVYEYRADWFESESEPVNVASVLQFQNGGDQLPAGTIRVYMRDVDGEPKFVGENALGHTPAGSELSVKTGEAFDVTVQPTLDQQEKVSLLRSRYSMTYAVRNARGQPVTVEIRQGGLWRDGKVIAESQKSRRADARTLVWQVAAPANGEAKLSFTVETGW